MDEQPRRPTFLDANSHEQQSDLRDSSATLRDLTANRLDQDAACDDARAEQREDATRADRTLTPEAHAAVATASYWAMRDRLRASNDRVRAANDRLSAKADRLGAAHDRIVSSIDDLTGAYRRDAGLRELARDLDSAHCAGQGMVIGFIDVDGLKTINDNAGHAAGDDTLRKVAETLQSNLRKCDLVVRVGGDEFVFSAVGMDLNMVRNRMTRMNETLKRTFQFSVSVGLAKIRAGDSLADAIERADRDLYICRQMNRNQA